MELGQFYGSETYTRYQGLGYYMILTDWTTYVAEKQQAYWLMEAIAIHCVHTAKVRKVFIDYDLIVATLKPKPTETEPHAVELTLTGPFDEVLAVQNIPFSTFEFSGDVANGINLACQRTEDHNRFPSVIICLLSER